MSLEGLSSGPCLSQEGLQSAHTCSRQGEVLLLSANAVVLLLSALLGLVRLIPKENTRGKTQLPLRNDTLDGYFKYKAEDGNLKCSVYIYKPTLYLHDISVPSS